MLKYNSYDHCKSAVWDARITRTFMEISTPSRTVSTMAAWMCVSSIESRICGWSSRYLWVKPWGCKGHRTLKSCSTKTRPMPWKWLSWWTSRFSSLLPFFRFEVDSKKVGPPFSNVARSSEVSKITGDLIALLLGVNATEVFRNDMTLLEFVEVFTLVDRHVANGQQSHPDALMRIVWTSAWE